MGSYHIEDVNAERGQELLFVKKLANEIPKKIRGDLVVRTRANKVARFWLLTLDFYEDDSKFIEATCFHELDEDHVSAVLIHTPNRVFIETVMALAELFSAKFKVTPQIRIDRSSIKWLRG